MRLLKRWLSRFSVQKLHDDLDYWIHIGMGDDIVDLKTQRIEYQTLVEQSKTTQNDDIPTMVLLLLKNELKLPWYKRPTFWQLLKLALKI